MILKEILNIMTGETIELPVIEQAGAPAGASSALLQETSLNQIKIVTEGAETLADMYADKKTMTGNESFLYHGQKLENYKIEIKNGYIHIVDKDFNFKYGFFSLGNIKLKSDKNVTYVIWNILQKTSCRFKTDYCDFHCYADQYPNTTRKNVIARAKNLMLSTFSNFEQIFAEVLEIVNKIYGGTEIRIRIHESGDFYNNMYYNKIANVLNNSIYKNKALAYTKNIEVLPLLKFNEEHFNTRFSIMPDTSEEHQREALKHECNYYICLDDTIKGVAVPKCSMKCTTCNMCQNSNIKVIAVDVHGNKAKKAGEKKNKKRAPRKSAKNKAI